MQPHSMCGLALALKVWNTAKDYSHLTKGVITVSYRRLDGTFKNNRYELSQIKITPKQIKTYVMRGGGGIACELTLDRSSDSEGSEVTQTHSQQHVANLREIFKLMKKKIILGRHENSARYGQFEAESAHPDNKRLRLRSQVKAESGNFVTLDYELEIEALS